MRDRRENRGTNALACWSNPLAHLHPDAGTDLGTNYLGTDLSTNLSSESRSNLSTNHVATRRNIFTHLQPDGCPDNRD
jgi:hypothetical protein